MNKFFKFLNLRNLVTFALLAMILVDTQITQRAFETGAQFLTQGPTWNAETILQL